MQTLLQNSAGFIADAANSFWHEASVFGIAIVSFVIIMAHAFKKPAERKSRPFM